MSDLAWKSTDGAELNNQTIKNHKLKNKIMILEIAQCTLISRVYRLGEIIEEYI